MLSWIAPHPEISFLLSISTITSGSPFTVYSGIQQTGAGTIGADRPDEPEHRTFRAPAVPRDRATTILGGAQTTEASFRFPSGSRAGLDRTPGALERSAVILFEARHIMTSILRSSRQLRLATGKAVWSERTCNSAQSYLICLTSSTWDSLRTSSRVRGLA